jgi:hypothetical protein
MRGTDGSADAQAFPAEPVTQDVTKASNKRRAEEDMRMSDEAMAAIEAGIRAAFTTYSRDDDPDWRSASWIKSDECSELATSILAELKARGFEIVKARQQS